MIGTTGWQAREADCAPRLARRRGIGVVAAPNFAIGVNVFLAVAERAAELLARSRRSARGCTSCTTRRSATRRRARRSRWRSACATAGLRRGRDDRVDARRRDPGTHTLGFDAAAETITLTHTARDRAAFARGALRGRALGAGARRMVHDEGCVKA